LLVQRLLEPAGETALQNRWLEQIGLSQDTPPMRKRNPDGTHSGTTQEQEGQTWKLPPPVPQQVRKREAITCRKDRQKPGTRAGSAWEHDGSTTTAPLKLNNTEVEKENSFKLFFSAIEG
jgi:hypothetical protein